MKFLTQTTLTAKAKLHANLNLDTQPSHVYLPFVLLMHTVCTHYHLLVSAFVHSNFLVYILPLRARGGGGEGEGEGSRIVSAIMPTMFHDL